MLLLLTSATPINENNINMKNTQHGFSLIELMIGLVIGLIATLVITNVFSKFEQQKRVTTGGADAQTNGAIALYTIRREIENAGYGLPLFDRENTPYNCPINLTFNHDNSGATGEIGLSPLVITDGGTNSDSVIVRSGSTMKSGANVKITKVINPTTVEVETALGCTVNDAVLILQDRTTAPRCAMGRVTAVNPNTGTGQITIADISTTSNATLQTEYMLSCLGGWNETNFIISGNQLMRSGGFAAAPALNASPTASALMFPVVSDIVNIQAQYGISPIQSSNTVTEWVNATGLWAPAALSVANRNRIKAVRVAVIARSSLQERVAVSQNCDGATSGLARVCVWGDTTNVNLSADANWQNYRYKVYETVMQLRNVLWNKVPLCGDTPC